MNNTAPLPNSLAALDEREAANARRIEQLQGTIDELTRENTRIADAKALLKELGVIGYAVSGVVATTPTAGFTVPEMITNILREQGPKTALEVIAAIKEVYNVEADPNHVRPTLWRLTRDDRLVKKGDRYDVPA